MTRLATARWLGWSGTFNWSINTKYPHAWLVRKTATQEDTNSGTITRTIRQLVRVAAETIDTWTMAGNVRHAFVNDGKWVIWALSWGGTVTIVPREGTVLRVRTGHWHLLHSLCEPPWWLTWKYRAGGLNAIDEHVEIGLWIKITWVKEMVEKWKLGRKSHLC